MGRHQKGAEYIKVSVSLFEKGDYVITSEGVGIVKEDQAYGFYGPEDVLIKHKYGIPKGSAWRIDPEDVGLITKEEYGKEKK